jgi:four helix bundle protein
MTKDEGMTKSEGQKARGEYDPFQDDAEKAVVREEPDDENDEALTTNDERMTKSEIAYDDFGDAFWDAPAESIIREESRDKRIYDLEERTARFGEVVIDFAKTIPQSPVTSRIISQLVGAGTSVGANYVEADDAVSKKEFLKSIGTCKKETRETKHFLRMAVRAVPALKPEARKLWMEARELHLIFSKIWRSGRMNDAARITKDKE